MKKKVLICILITIVIVYGCESNHTISQRSETPISYSDSIFKANENLLITYNSLHSKSKFRNDTTLFLQLILYSIDQTFQYKFSLKKDKDGLFKYNYKIPDSVFYIKVVFKSKLDEYKIEVDENIVHKKVGGKYIPLKYALSQLTTKPKFIQKESDVDSLITLSHLTNPNDASIYIPIIYLLYQNKHYDKILEIEKVMISRLKSFENDLEQADKCNFLIALAYLKMLENEYEDCFYYLDRIIDNKYDCNINYYLQLDFFLSFFDKKPGKIKARSENQVLLLNKLLKILVNGSNFESLLNVAELNFEGLDKKTSECLDSIYIIIYDCFVNGKKIKYFKNYSSTYYLIYTLENLIKRKDFKKVDVFFELATRIMTERLISKDSSNLVYFIEPDNVCYLYHMMSKFKFQLNKNQEAVQYLNTIIDFTGNNLEKYINLKNVHIDLFKYYNKIENFQLSFEHLKQAFSIKLMKDKYDSLYLSMHNTLRKKFKLNEIEFNDFQDVEHFKIINNTFKLNEQEIKFIKKVSIEDAQSLFININDECMSCNVDLLNNLDKVKKSGLKIYIVSSIEEDKLKKVFSLEFSVIKRNKDIMTLLNSSIESNFCGALVGNNYKLLLSSLDQDYEKIKEYLSNN